MISHLAVVEVDSFAGCTPVYGHIVSFHWRRDTAERERDQRHKNEHGLLFVIQMTEKTQLGDLQMLQKTPDPVYTPPPPPSKGGK